MTRPHRRPLPTRAALALAAFVLLAAACGSNRPHDEHLAAAGAGPGTSGPSGGAGASTPGADLDDPGAVEADTSADGTGAGASPEVDSGSPASPAEGQQPAPGDAAPGEAARPTARGVLPIGMVGAMSGLVGTTLQPNYAGLRIWVQYANEQLGGANGATIELLTADDQSDPARHRSLVQELVDERGVQAFVGNGEPFSGAGSVSFHQSRGIPVIGSEGVGQYFYENSMYFPQMSHGRYVSVVAIGAAGQWAKANGVSKFGLLVCSESTACTETVRIARANGAQLGVDVVYSAEASLAKTDFTSECVNARNAGVELFHISGDANFLSRVAASCARQQYFPTLTTASSIASPQHLEDPNIKGFVVASPVAPYFLDSIPAVAEFQAAVQRYAPGMDLSIGLMTGWVSGKLFERATRGITEPSTKEILRGLHAIDGDTLGGLTGPLAFRAGGNATPFACWWSLVEEDGELTAPYGADAVCSDVTP